MNGALFLLNNHGYTIAVFISDSANEMMSTK